MTQLKTLKDNSALFTEKIAVFSENNTTSKKLSEILKESYFNTVEIFTKEELKLILDDPSIYLIFIEVNDSFRLKELLNIISIKRKDVEVAVIGHEKEKDLGERVICLVNEGFPETLPLIIARKAKEIWDLKKAYNSLNHVLTQEQVFDFMGALAEAIDAKSPYTRDHSERVAAISRRIARELKLSDKDVNIIYAGALLHDLGKVGIPDAILELEKPLNEEQKKLIQEHPIKGEKILAPIPAMAPILPIVRSHHENWDGTGYPDGLKGEEIHLFARIVKIADSYDAVTSFRPYRKTNLSDKEALEMLEKGRGKEFDPEILDIFFKMMKRISRKSFA